MEQVQSSITVEIFKSLQKRINTQDIRLILVENLVSCMHVAIVVENMK